MKSCSSCDRYVVESDESTWTVTLMFGLAFSKALIATCVCWPSVPSPDSANTMVWLALAETEELEPPELHAAAPVTSATAPMPTMTARHLIMRMRYHLTTVSNWIKVNERRLLSAGIPVTRPG